MRSTLILAVLIAAMPAGAQDTPLTAARFSISIDGVEIASFSELMGISSSVDVVERNRSGARPERFAVEGLVSLGRPLTGSLELSKWHEQAISKGPRIRKDMVLTVHGTDDRPVARYYLENAWPAKIEIGALKAGASEVLLETVTMTCEFIQRVPI